MTSFEKKFIFKQPTPEDGLLVQDLIQQCPPLDLNSSYCYMLCCTLWARTSICVWQKNGESSKAQLVGFISAFIRPDQERSLFVWQVAVAESARGNGLARQMLNALLQRPACAQVEEVQTTISPDNKASWRTFNALAAQLDCPSRTENFLDKELHFNGLHESELLFIIGPFLNPPPAA
ncbi:L-2,4-diaminobutyric acid acetyltransferase [Oceanospirillum multiglobuliferum]|uniref:L-2,4-diaminobutyric acid acetyltransferase n=1 Tax=Oceanospirillum multiglobuliferum TaxID=64969 RepID=A0A1T4MK13_9GAMM|nr:diaminobutyrate acetyltransferase [Oceanospirillum multiglobuliferum]OPX56990.1 diaminobutyrate acetyltransferase [Oceanospirillum multiglobuliferum]SJZ67430.1 L-2,4-diaminobutyric acid acetyltransferase [Oceanospirillum multiglobuliferum]